MPALRGEPLPDVPVIAEYHGEGIMRPSFMVRHGAWKLIYCHGSAPQMFNLDEDPGEWNNRAGDPDLAEIETALLAVITDRFDLDFIARDVWDRLAQKQVVNAAMKSNNTAWDYRVDQDVASLYIRK